MLTHCKELQVVVVNKIAQYAPHILRHIGDLRGRQVLILGDVGVDEYVLGQVRRISPEAPVPIVEVENEETRLGLAGNVAQNVASLGGVPVMISAVGQDACAEQLRSLLKQAGVSPAYLVVDDSRPTTRKLRVMVQNHHIVRVDYEQRRLIPEQIENAILHQVIELLPQVSNVIIQDYAKGVITERLVKEVVRLAHAQGKMVLVDPNSKTPLGIYRGADVMTPNYDESIALSGVKIDELRAQSDALNQIGQKLMHEVGASQMVITRGKEGMRLFEKNQVTDMPTYARQVFDVTGAGDTVIAALALAWGPHFTLEQACAFGNFAAGVVVGKVGCVPCRIDELMHYIQSRVAEI